MTEFQRLVVTFGLIMSFATSSFYFVEIARTERGVNLAGITIMTEAAKPVICRSLKAKNPALKKGVDHERFYSGNYGNDE